MPWCHQTVPCNLLHLEVLMGIQAAPICGSEMDIALRVRHTWLGFGFPFGLGPGQFRLQEWFLLPSGHGSCQNPTLAAPHFWAASASLICALSGKKRHGKWQIHHLYIDSLTSIYTGFSSQARLITRGQCCKSWWHNDNTCLDSTSITSRHYFCQGSFHRFLDSPSTTRWSQRGKKGQCGAKTIPR